MELNIDRQGWSQPPRGQSPEGDESRPDWHGLRSRLAAACGLREMFTSEHSAADGSASFHGDSARQIATYGQGLTPVNLNNLGDGKSPDGNVPPVDGGAVPGDRGPE